MALTIDLAGRTAIVTGATSGMGQAAAQALAAAGANVVAVGRDADRLAETTSAIEQAGGTAIGVLADLVDEDGPQRVVAAALEAYGSLAIVVSCAGIYDSAAMGQEGVDTLSVLDRQWEINARAPYRLAEAALPHLSEGASMVFFSSTMARFGIGYGAGYSMSKAAVEAMVRVMAVELGPLGIRVNAISPGWIVTPMNEAARADPAIENFAIAATPMGRLGTVDDVASVVVYLASDAAAYVHGTVIHAEGGYPALPMSMLQNA
ncbi:MAG: Short-chain dehydrogenase/reductase [Solirubrobacterales bacterium]|nr:Short-chain dehydrogenase/reductase [Solirubrobacterales bacterium]